MRARLLVLPLLVVAGLSAPALADPPSAASSTDYVDGFHAYTFVDDACVAGSTCTQRPSADPGGALSAGSTFDRQAADPLTPAVEAVPAEHGTAFGEVVLTVRIPKKAASVKVTASFTGLTGAAGASSVAGVEQGYAGVALCLQSCSDSSAFVELVGASSVYGVAGTGGSPGSVSGEARDVTVTLAPSAHDRTVTVIAYLYATAAGRNPRACPPEVGGCVAELPTGHAGTASSSLAGVLSRIHVETS